jgi:hypothetical protein
MVDGLKRELTGRADVLRLNVADAAGQRAQAVFQTTLVPTLILLDRHGVQRYRTEGKLPRRQEILAALLPTAEGGGG